MYGIARQKPNLHFTLLKIASILNSRRFYFSFLIICTINDNFFHEKYSFMSSDRKEMILTVGFHKHKLISTSVPVPEYAIELDRIR